MVLVAQDADPDKSTTARRSARALRMQGFVIISTDHQNKQSETFEKWLHRGSKSFSHEILFCLNMYEIKKLV
jgi:hypothetical protein